MRGGLYRPGGWRRVAGSTTHRYTGPVRSVADDLRLRTIARVLALPMAARINLALSLGDDDLELFTRHSRLARDEARKRLRAGRACGRASSVTSLEQP